jgi:hypothetical protein
MRMNIPDDDARLALSRVLDQSASEADRRKVKKYLRATEDGRKAVVDALRSVTTERVLSHIGRKYSSGGSLDVWTETLAARADVMQAELDAESATAAERLVVQQVVDAWTRLEFVQVRYDHALVATTANNSDELRLWDRMLTKAQHRYLRALESLARIRRYELQVVDRLDADGSQERSIALRANS